MKGIVSEPIYRPLLALSKLSDLFGNNLAESRLFDARSGNPSFA